MPQAHPFFFGPARRPLFGWLHQPDTGGASDVGLLICSPLGYDAVSSHRTLRHLAEAAAARGIPALRFDYDGTGDSSGQDTDPARMAAWSDSIGAAAATLREQTGVRHIYLFGVRLGASLALMCAQHLPEVSGVILANPVIEGRRYLRELRVLAATSVAAAGDTTPLDQDMQEAAGFITTAETRQVISSIRLAGDSLQRAPARALLLERTDLPVDNSLTEHLQQLGCNVMRLPFPGYADMLRDAHETLVPDAVIRDTLSWIQQEPHGFSTSPAARFSDNCDFSWTDEERTDHLREEAVRFGTAGTIFGVLTQSSDSTARAARCAPVLLLLNSGAVQHVGPNRLYVRIARLLALRGITVLRFDLPGLGDSPVQAGDDENQSYPAWATAAVGQAVDYVKNRFPGSAIHSAGICSGAYHSLKAAVAALPLQSIIVINPLTFFWKPGMSMVQPAYQDIAEIMRYRRSARSMASLRKLVTGGVDLRNLTKVVGRSTLRRLRHLARNLGRHIGLPLRDDLVAELRTIHWRGTQVHFVFSTTDPGYPMLRVQGGSEVRRLLKAGGLSIDFIDQSDHTFTPRTAQQKLLSVLARLVLA